MNLYEIVLKVALSTITLTLTLTHELLSDAMVMNKIYFVQDINCQYWVLGKVLMDNTHRAAQCVPGGG
jgi:hypothetical protein